MTNDEIREKLESIVRLNLRRRSLPDPLADACRLNGDLGLNSADVIDIVLDLEERFQIHIADEDIAAFKTFGDLVAYISTRAPT
jgi:acyl carrier protein